MDYWDLGNHIRLYLLGGAIGLFIFGLIISAIVYCIYVLRMRKKKKTEVTDTHSEDIEMQQASMDSAPVIPSISMGTTHKGQWASAQSQQGPGISHPSHQGAGTSVQALQCPVLHIRGRSSVLGDFGAPPAYEQCTSAGETQPSPSTDNDSPPAYVA